MKKIKRIALYVCLCILTSCAEIDEIGMDVPGVPETPDVITTTTTEMRVSARFEGTIIYIGTSADFKNAETMTFAWSKTYAYIDNLKPYTTYYYQAVVSNSVGSEIRGVIKSFTTSLEINEPVCSAYYASSDNTMSLSADVLAPNGSTTILEYGFCFSQTTSAPTVDTEGVVITNGSGISSIINNGKTHTITGFAQAKSLKKGVITYVRAYVRTEKGVSYSAESSYYFPVSGIKDNRPYVDLGLPSGTLWTVSNYRGPGNLSDLPTIWNYFYEENYTSSNFGTFRKPTFEDAKEIYDNCTYAEVKINNTDCAKITSHNGNAIYIPLSGYRNSVDYLYKYGITGYIWLNSQTNDGFWRIINFSDDTKIGYTYYSYHGYKYNIRLVLDK